MGYPNGIRIMCKWMFIDMNCFFAAVEQHLRPELRGKAVGVVPVESEYTSVIAASYEAKRFGIRVGTPVIEAREKCPGIEIVKARPAIYVETHHAILRSIDTCAPIHKVYSIDEWAIELIGRERHPDVAMALGRKIKARLLKDFGPCLTCSIGIAPTRLLGKIASDLQKPDGLVVLDPAELPGRIEHLTPRDLCGIGRNMAERLRKHGIMTVHALWELSRRESVALWGNVSGGYWWAGFHGIDEPEIPTRRSSMTHANVLDPKFRNEAGAYGILIRLLCRLGSRLRHDGYCASMLHVSVSDRNENSWHLESMLPQIQDTCTLLEHFEMLWRRRPAGKFSPLHVGVTVGGLVPASQVSGSLFSNMEKPAALSRAMDALNKRWGASAVYFAPMHGFRHQMDDKIAFGRIPSSV